MLWTMYDKHLVKRLVQNGHTALSADKLVKDRHPAAREILLNETTSRPVLINRAPTLHKYNIVAAYPKMVPGKTIRVNPFVEEGMGADYDGDTMMVHVPSGIKAVEEARGLTLSNMLYSDKSKKDLLVFPQHEAIMGVAHASQVDERNKAIEFKNEGDAQKAYAAGKIGLGTRVKIGK
jgi:DNA-directed RNA polymerase subunit beta'